MVRGFKRAGLHGLKEESVAARKRLQTSGKVLAFCPRVRLKDMTEVVKAKL
jgi:hypothetical protein